MDMQLTETEKMGERNPVSEVESRFTFGNNEFKLFSRLYGDEYWAHGKFSSPVKREIFLETNT